VKYHEAFPDLAGVVLEDSWVLEVAPGASGLALRLDAALTRDHREYVEPKAGEVGCYRRGWLTVRSVAPVEVRVSGTTPAVDATGEADFGHVDTFAQDAEGRWELEGDWGYARIPEAQVTLELE